MRTSLSSEAVWKGNRKSKKRDNQVNKKQSGQTDKVSHRGDVIVQWS